MESISKPDTMQSHLRKINNKPSPYYLKKNKIQYQSIDNIDKRLLLIKTTKFLLLIDWTKCTIIDLFINTFLYKFNP